MGIFLGSLSLPTFGINELVPISRRAGGYSSAPSFVDVPFCHALLGLFHAILGDGAHDSAFYTGSELLPEKGSESILFHLIQ